MRHRAACSRRALRPGRYREDMTALTEYVAAWVHGDPESIAALVSEGCVVTECYGPVYRGRPRVRQWAQAWFGAGGTVHRWVLMDHFVSGDREVAQWTFECTFRGSRGTFEGATIARVADGLITELREYETSAPLYDWEGSWR
ncbi:nuclear transport factor 2 family protein [Brachybacterium sp. AOP3-A1-3]|uniref:nuclear transport factor 2 family protein n=1 Tax=Brachybacterium sp. AOP3-A1-3 TaxID=3457699 RepID=UPI00403415A3